MVDALIKSASEVVHGMRRTDPFLAFMLVLGGCLVGWYVYQQQIMNDKLIQIQIDAGLDGREKVATIQALVKAQNRTAEIAERAALIQEQGTHTMSKLALAVTEARTFDIGTRALVLDVMRDSEASTNDMAKTLHELVDHVKKDGGIEQ